MNKPTETTPRTISKDDYIRLVGLLALVDHHRGFLDSIEKAICSMVGEKFNEGGHVGDSIYAYEQTRSADSLLGKLGIEVVDAD